MLGHSHLVMGIASWTLAGSIEGYAIDLPSVCCAVIGGLLPDIDHPRSMINRQFKPMKLAAKWIPHRGPTHSLLFLAGLCGALLWLDMHADPYYQGWLLALWVGTLSHLVTDWMTRGGVPLLWPFPQRFRMPFAFITGAWQEKAVVSLAIFSMFVYFSRLYTHPWVIQAAFWVEESWGRGVKGVLHAIAQV